jgi:pSer/pThr/pTyr-binding forkhead associated (FHA) protein
MYDCFCILKNKLLFFYYQSPHVDNQHALIEYDDEQRCFILKDLNSSSGTYVHECRVQNAAVRLANADFIRFGFNGFPLEFRIEQQQQEIVCSFSNLIIIYDKSF